MNQDENEYPGWLKDATRLETDQQKTPEKPSGSHSGEKSEMTFTDSPLKSDKEETIEIENKANTWVEDIYIKVWKRDYTNGLTMRELLTRFVEPESPRWYYLKAHKIHKYAVRYKCWHIIRQELYAQISNIKYNVYGYHNAAVLTFLMGETEIAIKIVAKLIETIPSPTLLMTIAHFYIETDQLEDAACVLYNLLNDSDPNLHAIFLAMKILTKKMSQVVPEPTWFERLFYTSKSKLGNLKEMRDRIMPSLCQLKPNNHLYKLYLMHWGRNEVELSQFLNKTEVIKSTQTFLKSLIEQDGSQSLKYDYVINTIVSFILFTGVTLFIKNVILPTWRAYKRQSFQNIKMSKQISIPKPEIREKPEPWKFPVIKKEESPPMDSMILRDYEYVDNLFQEIQFLSKEVLPSRKSVDSITNRGFKTIEDLPQDEITTTRNKLSSEPSPDQGIKSVAPLKTFGKGNKPSNAKTMLNKFSQFK